MRSPVRRDKPTAVKQKQPACHWKKRQHELAGLFGEQQSDSYRGDGQLEPDGLLHDPEAEGEEDKEKEVLQVIQGVGVLLEGSESGHDRCLDGTLDPMVRPWNRRVGQHGGTDRVRVKEEGRGRQPRKEKPRDRGRGNEKKEVRKVTVVLETEMRHGREEGPRTCTSLNWMGKVREKEEEKEGNGWTDGWSGESAEERKNERERRVTPPASFPLCGEQSEW